MNGASKSDEGQCRGGFLESLLGKAQQQTESIPVTGDGVRTGISLPDKPLGKVGLQ